MRVVSVLPSATELVYALGHGSELRARSAECDHPPEARHLPVVMRPRTLDGERASREIDARVSAARGRGESLYALDVPLLRSLAPELLLTQDLCGVCSVTDREVADACAEAGVRPLIVALRPRTLSDVAESFATVASALGDPGATRRLDRFWSARPAPRPARGRVAVVEWLDPPILAGLWTPELVRTGGGDPLGPAPGAVGLRTDWETIARARPDLLVLSPCSFPVERTRRELRDPALRAAIARVAPPRGTFVADEAYFSRPGPRLAHGAVLIDRLLAGDVRELPMPAERWGPAHEGAVA